MRYSVDVSTLQKIINYIAGKPYMEVSALIEELQKDAVLIEEESQQQELFEEGTAVNEN
jgi:hypothetical protein